MARRKVDRAKAVKGWKCCIKGDCNHCQYKRYAWCKRVLENDTLALLKQDYRAWLIEMFHKYGHDELIALMVQYGEEEQLAGLLKEHDRKIAEAREDGFVKGSINMFLAQRESNWK